MNLDDEAVAEQASDAEHRVVIVYRVRIGNSYAACSCGWSARRRMLKAAACQDAWTHSARGACHVNFPLIVPAGTAANPLMRAGHRVDNHRHPTVGTFRPVRGSAFKALR
ncbi:hypothetical protein ABGB19_04095 [Mycobacterium sp. B14F4]|uniref:hypothetical protein n=1 Tax=Mycobacterium sp. B14F4 TaxID=3153565 RepID=UPI00325D2DEB